MADLLKNNLKRKINNTKDEKLYIDCRFIFGSAALEHIKEWKKMIPKKREWMGKK